MFGEDIEFDCIEHFKTNEALIGIALKLPGCTTIPTVNLNDIPDKATAEDIANISATTFQDALRGFKGFPIVLMEAARRNIVSKFGIQLISIPEMSQFFTKGHHQEPKPFADVQMVSPGLYTLTNGIEVNGAAWMLIPEILEQIGEKAGMDYFVLLSSIHELLVARNDGLVSSKMLKGLVHEGNRTDSVVKPEDVLSDNIYFYSRKEKSLKIV